MYLVLKPDRVARAYSELRCTFGDRSLAKPLLWSLVPDISVFRWERIPRDENGKVCNNFTVAPDWTIEILSPAQSQTKVVRNILYCLYHGTQMGWLIDPEEEIIEGLGLKPPPSRGTLTGAAESRHSTQSRIYSKYVRM